MAENTNYYDLYKALKADGAVKGDWNSFRSFIGASGKQGYLNRKKLYDALKADGAVQAGSYEEFHRGLYKAGKQWKSQRQNTASANKPSTVRSMAAQVANEYQGKGGVDYLSRPQAQRGDAPTEVPKKASPFAQSLYETENAMKGAEYPINYTSPKAVKQVYEKNQQVKRDASRTAAKQNEWNRQNQPIYDNGTKGVMKTQGQLEKEIDDAAGKFIDSNMGDYISKAILDEQNAAMERGLKASDRVPATAGGAGGLGLMLKGMAFNKEVDSDVMGRNLSKSVQDNIQKIFSDPRYVKQIENEAAALGISTDGYIQSLASRLQGKLLSELDKSELKNALPKNGLENFANRFIGSNVLGNMIKAATQTKSQRTIDEQAMAATEAGENPYYKPGTWENVAADVVGMATDPVFHGSAGIGGKVAGKLIGSSDKIGAILANGNVMQRLGLNVGRAVTSGGVTGFVFGSSKGAIQNVSTGEDTSLGGTLKAALHGGLSEAGSFATMGVAGVPLGMVGRSIGLKSITTTPLTKEWFKQGTAKVGLEAAKTWMEGTGMYLGGYVAGKIEGREQPEFDIIDGTIESLPTAIGFRVQHLLNGLGSGRLRGEDGNELSWGKSTMHKFNEFLTSDKAKASKYLMSEDERNQILNSEATKEIMRSGDNVVSIARRAKSNKISYDDPYLETDIAMVRNSYDKIMADPNVSWDAKAKFSAMVMGVMPSSRPMADYHTFTLEKLGDDKVGYKKYINEYSAKGELLAKISYDTAEQRGNILYRRTVKTESDRFWNAYAALVNIEKNDYNLQNQFFVKEMKNWVRGDGNEERFMAGMKGYRGSTFSDKYTAYVADRSKMVSDALKETAEKLGVSDAELVKAVNKDPLKRTDAEQNACVELRKTFEKAAYPEGKAHEEQSKLEGKDVARENGLGTDAPNGEAVKQELVSLQEAEDGLQKLMDSNDVFKESYEMYKGQGLTNAEIYQRMIEEGGMTEDQLEPFAMYINGNARVQGMQDATEQAVEQHVESVAADWSFHGTMDGQKADGSQIIYVKDNNGRTLIVGSGDVAYDPATGRPKEGVGDMLVCLDVETRQPVYVKVEDTTLAQTQSVEDFKNEERTRLQQINSEPYNEAAQEQAMSDATKTKGSEREDGQSLIQSPEDGSAAALSALPPDPNGGKGTKNDQNTQEKEVLNTDSFNKNTESPDRISNEKDEWGQPLVKASDGSVEFGKIDEGYGLQSAPIRLSLGENKKNPETGKDEGYGLLHIIARHGDQIRKAGYKSVQDFVEAVAKGYTEIREGVQVGTTQTYLIVKKDGHANTLYIELSRDGKYWNINSAGIFKEKYVNRKKEITPEPTVGSSTSTDTTGVNHGTTEGAAVTSGNSPMISNGKVNENSSNGNGNGVTLTFADGSPVPMVKDSKGRETPDYGRMKPEQAAEMLTMQFGESAEKVADGQIKKAEKAVKKAEKMKVDYEGEPNDILEQEAVRREAIAQAKAQLEHAQATKKAMTAKKVAETMGKTEEKPTEGANQAGSVAAERFQKATRIVGNKRSRTLPNNEKITGHYEIVPAESLTPSHDATDGYRKSDGFPVDAEGRTTNDRDYENDKAAQQSTDQMAAHYNGQAIEQVPVVSDEGIVYDGNGRTMAGQKAAKEGTDGEYTSELLDNAESFGFTREQIEKSGIEHPRLVLVSDERMPYTTETFAKFNRNEKKTQSNTEQAVAKSKTLSPEDVGSIVSEIEGNGSLEAFFNNPNAISSLWKTLQEKGIIGQNEVAGLQDIPGVPNAQGKEFVKNLVLGAMFKPETIRMMGVDGAIKNKVIGGIRAIMDNSKLGDYALGEEIDGAIRLLYEARIGKMSVDDLLRSSDFVQGNARDRYSQLSQAIAQALEGKASLFRELMSEYNDIARNYNTAEGSLGFYENLDKEGLIKQFVLKSKTINDNNIKLYGEEGRHSEKKGSDVPASDGQHQEKAGGGVSEEKRTEERQRVDTAVKKLATEITRKTGVAVHTDEKESQKALEDAEKNGSAVRKQAMIGNLTKAANAIKGWLKGGKRGKSFTIELPFSTQRMIKNVMGRDFDSHNITANGVAHAKKNHGVGGKKVDTNSIPLRDEDFELMPYIMTSPDYVRRGSTDASGRESVRFYKDLHNGYVVVAEKEYKNSPDDMETITMWAEKSSSEATNARRNAPDTHVQNAILSTEDAAKIRKDAETAIENDVKLREQRVFHGSGADFDHFDHSHMGEGEGAQAYGWGTYVTEVEGIGRTYAHSSAMGDSAHEEMEYTGDALTKNEVDLVKYAFDGGMRTYHETEHFLENIANGNGAGAQRSAQALALLRKTKPTDWKHPLQNRRHLYTVEIPDDTGENYLDWDKPLTAKQHDTISGAMKKLKIDLSDFERRGFSLDSKGEDVYHLLSYALRHTKKWEDVNAQRAVSKFLSSLGFVGIKYPADYYNGGREDGKQNYVIFNEKDMKITDHVRFFRTKDGEAYGFVVGGEIHLDTKKMKPETPLHEYTHLWTSALQRVNAKEWENVKKLLDSVEGLKEEVKKLYPELKGDDLYDEMLATYSGREGAKKLEEEAKRIAADEGKTLTESVKAKSFLDKVREALKRYWKATADMLHVKFTSAEEVADKVLADWASGMNPNEIKADEKNPLETLKKSADEYNKGKLRYQKADDADYIEDIPKGYRDFSDEHGVNPVNLFGYGESMKYNDSAAASRYLHDLKAMYLREHIAEKKALMEREGVSGLIANRRLFAPIEKAIKEKYGDVDVLIEERKKRVEAERGVMEAARKRAEEEERKRQQHLEELSLVSDEDLDKRYLEAMEKGDETTAREMLDEAARRKGYGDAESDYQGVGAWSAPSNPGYESDEARRNAVGDDSPDLNVADMAAGYSNQPEDVFLHPKKYSQGLPTSEESGKAIQEAIDAIRSGKADVKIKVYRAVPASVKEGKLRNGDWVTPSRKYAEMYGEHRLDGKYRIMEDEVPAKELWWDSNDVNEWGYDNGKSYRYKNVKNNRKLNDLVTRDDKGNIIPPSKRFNSRKADERYQKVDNEQAKADKREQALRDEVVGTMRKAGLDVSMDTDEGQRMLDEANGKVKMSAKKRRALETVSVSQDEKHQPTVVSSADGAKVLKELDTTKEKYENQSSRTNTFLGDVAKALGAQRQGSASEYATFETKNGRIVTIRLANHNAKVSNFDHRDESEGISIVVSPKKSVGMENDGDAHVVEYYYDAIKLRRAEGKPLAEIVRSIKQALYSGEFNDTTGLAERQEVNGGLDHVRFFRTADGEAYGYTIGGKIYIDPRIANSETPVHEYAHLWATALRNGNAKEWANVVGLMKDTKVWDEVRKRYPELEADDEIADEVLATYSGRRGAERLRKEMDAAGGNAKGALERVKQAIHKFWKATADMLHIHYTSAEDVADRVMKDLLDGVDPREFGGVSEKVRKQFIGERGAEKADRTEEVNTRLENLRVARKMEAENKDAKAIKMATGWERGADGKWRYEIADGKFHPKGDAEYEKLRSKQPWSKELDALADRIFDGEELGESENKRFEELAEQENKFKAEFLSQEKRHLADWIENKELFDAYPDLKNVEMVFTDQLPKNEAGYYSEKENRLVVNTAFDMDYIESVIAHEVQHAIQRKEGFAVGGSTEGVEREFQKAKAEWAARAYAHELEETAKELGEYYNQVAVEKALIKEYEDMDMQDWLPDMEARIKGFNYFARGYADRSMDDAIKRFRLDESVRGDFNPYTEYRKLAGEVEARNVQNRMGMTPEERRASLAAETEDVAREDQVFLRGGEQENMAHTSDPMDALTRAADEYGNEQRLRLQKKDKGGNDESLEKLFLSLQSKDKQNNKKEYYDTVTELARRMAEGTADNGGAEEAVSSRHTRGWCSRMGRYSGSIKSGFKSVEHCAAAIIGLDCTRGLPEIRKQATTTWRQYQQRRKNNSLPYKYNSSEDKWIQKSALEILNGRISERIEDWAKQNNCWLDWKLFDEKYPTENRLGDGTEQEADVFRSVDGKTVIKFIRPEAMYGDCFPNPAISKLEEIALENYAFKSDERKVIGFNEGDLIGGAPRIIVEQSFVKGKTVHEIYGDKETTEGVDFIDKALEKQGFKKGKIVEDTWLGDMEFDVYYKDGVILQDVNTHNVIVDDKGNAHVVDCIAEPNYGQYEKFGIPREDTVLDEYPGTASFTKDKAEDVAEGEMQIKAKNDVEVRHLEREIIDERKAIELLKESRNDENKDAIDDSIAWHEQRIKKIKKKIADKKAELDGGVHYRVEGDLSETNRKFNDRLDSLMKDPTQKGRELQLGRPGEFLKDAGLGDAEIVLDYDKLVKKSSESYKNEHPFDIADIKDLPNAINSPIAVFDNTNGQNRGKVILTELERDGNNFIVAVRATERHKKGGVVLEVNEVKSLFPKEARGIVNWLNTNKACNINKEKALDWLGALRNHRGTELTEQELSDAAKVVNSFDISKQKGINYRIGDSSSVVDSTKNPSFVTTHVSKIARKLGSKVNMVNSADEVTNPAVRERLDRGEEVTGWYDEKTGEVYLYMPNIHDRYTAEKTIWHETVGHKGMRGLFGDKFDDFLYQMWKDLDKPENAELKKLVDEELKYNPLNIYNAMEEGIARLAEEGKGEVGFWNTIKNKVTSMLRSIGYHMAPNTSDVKYLLWLGKNLQKNPNNPYWKMRAEAVRYKLEHEKADVLKDNGGYFVNNDGKMYDGLLDLSHRDFEEATDGTVHFRTTPMTASKIQEYNHRLSTKTYAFKESTVDHLQSLQEAMEVISGEKDVWRNIPSAFNPLQAANRIDAVCEQLCDKYDRKFTKPLDTAFKAAVNRMSGQDGLGQKRNTELYMIQKHGLERNRVFYVRDEVRKLRKVEQTRQDADTLQRQWNAEKKDLDDKLQNGIVDLMGYYDQMDKWIRNNVDKTYIADEHDYSGFHEMQGKKDNENYDDQQAIDDVMSAESQLGYTAKELWDATKAATDATIDQEFNNGFIDRETRDHLKGMFSYYVPLRRYDDTTAEEVYGYISEGSEYHKNAGPVIAKAKGRHSLSDVNVMAQISAMAKASIMNGGKNIVKQHFARFVSAYESGNSDERLFVEVKPWMEKHVVDGNEVWEEVTPQIPVDATQQQISNILQDFENDMQAKKAKGEAKEITRETSAGYKFERAKDKSQHLVEVYVAGKKRTFFCQGNPRAAQAVNGLLKDSGTKSWITRQSANLNRFCAQMNTSFNPDFMLSNMMRDLTFASANVTKEGRKYTQAFIGEYKRNLLSFFNGRGDGNFWTMFSKYRNERLNTNDKRERYFKEFMENGGETGFVHMEALDKLMREYDNLIKTGKKIDKGWLMRKLSDGGGIIEAANEVIENLARYSTYAVSREQGRSIGRSIYDAKEVSTNFNRHGSGDAIGTLRTENDSTFDVAYRKTLGFFNSFMKSHTMFYNAGIQGANLFVKNMKQAPATNIISFLAMPMGLGVATSIINQWLIGREDKDERNGVEDPYAELPEWKRRNNLCFYVGNGSFVTIPIAIELRSFYGLADIAMGMFNPNLRSDTPVGYDILGQMAQLVPSSDFLGHHAPADGLKEMGKDALLSITPTTLKPVAELALNRDWTGRPIYRDKDYLDNAPRWKRAYDSTNGVYMTINQWANKATNGIDSSNEDMKGSDTADFLTAPYGWQHMVDGYLGGAFATMGRATKAGYALGKTIKDAATGKEDFGKEWGEFDKNQIPFWRVFNYKATEGNEMQRTKSKWYNYADELKQTEYNVNQLKTNTPDVAKNLENAAKKYNFYDTQEGKMLRIYEAADSYISKKRRLLKKVTDPETLKSIQGDINRKMQEAVKDLDSMN